MDQEGGRGEAGRMDAKKWRWIKKGGGERLEGWMPRSGDGSRRGEGRGWKDGCQEVAMDQEGGRGEAGKMDAKKWRWIKKGGGERLERWMPRSGDGSRRGEGRGW